MAFAGVGVDLVEIARMEEAITRRPRLKRRLFTDAERAYCERRARPAEHYAARFAAREAVLKALGTGFAGMGFKDVEVVVDERTGAPSARLFGAAAARAQELGVQEVALSLSHTREVAVANAVLVTESARPKAAEKPDPKREMAASFREARSILDELERVSEDELHSLETSSEASPSHPASPPKE